MRCNCQYDKDRDLGEASQSGFVVLDDLLAHGVVPANLNVAPESFNDIEDPRSIYGRPSDQFEAMTLAKTLDKRAAAAEAVAARRKVENQQ